MNVQVQRGVTVSRVRGATGLAAAVGFHLAVGFMFINQPPLRQVGDVGPDQGSAGFHANGTIVILNVRQSAAVEGELAGGSDATPARTQSRGSDDSSRNANAEATVRPERGGPSTISALDTPHIGTSDERAAAPEPPLAVNFPTTDPVAKVHGETEGATEILAQIARCLGVPTNLPGAKLLVSFDGKGQLTAPPQVDFGLETPAPETVASADRVVQATLQCEPYRNDDGHPVALILAVDFTKTTLSTSGEKSLDVVEP